MKNEKIVEQRDDFYFQWHFIESCNLRCIHCYQNDYKFKDLEKEKIFKIASILDSTLGKWKKNGRISLTGGEPFLRKNLLFDLLDYFEKSNNFHWIGILSNGTLIDNKIIKELKQFKKLKEIQISIDGSSSNLHNKIRGEGSFEKSINAIKKLKENDFYVSMMFTLHSLNKDDVIDVMELAEKLGIDALTIERITPMNKDDIEKLYIESGELHSIYQKIYRKKKQIEKRSNLELRVSRPLWGLIDNELGGFCPAGLTSLSILYDGTVLPCRRLEVPVGNILEDGLFKIWYTSDVLWKLRNKNLLGDKCRDCELLANCGGCRAIAYTVNGDYMADDPQCWK